MTIRGAGIYGGNAGAAGWQPEELAKWDQAAAAAAVAADRARTEQERAIDGPFIHRPDALGQPPEAVQAETPAQYEARKRADTELAKQLGLEPPIMRGPDVGQCPGTTSYGHGLSLTTVHGGSCCQRWDEAREQAIAAAKYEPTAIDELMVTDPARARLEIARNSLLEVEANHASQVGRDRLTRQTEPAEADLSGCQTCHRDAHRPGPGWQGHYYNPSPSVAQAQAEPDAGR